MPRFQSCGALFLYILVSYKKKLNTRKSNFSFFLVSEIERCILFNRNYKLFKFTANMKFLYTVPKLLGLLFCLFFSFSIFASTVVEIRTGAALIAVDYSPDGKKLVTGGQSNEVCLWDAKTGNKLATMKGHTDNVVAVKFSPNGRLIASGGVDNKLIIWDAISGEMMFKIAGHKDYVRHVAFSPDNKLVASASWDNTAMVWNTRTGELITTISGHLDNVTTVAFSPDGKELLTGSGDKTIRAWDTQTWAQKYILRGHTDEVWDAKYSPNGKFIASGGWDNKARIWNIETKKEIFTFNAHTSDVWCVCFSPDNQFVATGGGDRKLYIWDMATGEKVSEISGDAFTAEIENVCFSPDGKNIVAVSRDGYLRIFETPVMYDRKSAYISHRLSEWVVKSTYEKWEDYRKRIQEEKPLKEEFYKKECEEVISKYFKENVDWQKMTIKEYDAEKEVFYAKSEQFGSLIIRVPSKEAESFKNNFSLVHVKNAHIVMGKLAPELFSASLETYNNKEYNVAPMSAL